MNRQAVFHRTYSEYSFALAPERVVLRLRAARGDLMECRVCYGDRMDPNTPIRLTERSMRCAASDGLFDYFEAEIDPGVTRLCYFFRLFDGRNWVCYYNDEFHDEPEQNRQLYYNFHYIRQEDIPRVPEWAKRAVMYQIYPDSFATGRDAISGESKELVGADGLSCGSRHGGTLRGIRENLPFLTRLGVDCLYLTPIFRAESWHKYDTIDYMEIDPCFGTKRDFRELVDACHRAGVRIILDGVFNHCGAGFFAFRDLLENGEQSRYRDWFYPKGFPLITQPVPNYECFAYVGFMPKLNTGNPEVARYLIGVGEYWVREFGIDGWRLDVANEIDHDFWRSFRQAVRAINPEALLIGEIWDDARSFLDGDQFDSAMNYNLYFPLTEFFARDGMTPREFSERVAYLLMRYKRPVQQAQLNLIDSHDVPRFLSQAGGDRDRLRLAALFLLTHVGIPMIFYGDEKGIEGWDEADYRKPMVWDFSEDSLFVYYQKLIQLRKSHPDAMLGGYDSLVADEAVYAYLRRGRREAVLIAMNVSGETVERRLPFPEGFRPEGKCCDALTNAPYAVDGDAVSLKLTPRSAAVIVLRSW